MAQRGNYETSFTGGTKAILRLLTGIFLDTGLDIRRKHMFGHTAFLYRGHVFLLVGEWPREHRGELVTPSRVGEAVPTVIVPIRADESGEGPGYPETLLRIPGSGYFAPDGKRLASWISLAGGWLLDEGQLQPIVADRLGAVGTLPPKHPKHPGYAI